VSTSTATPTFFTNGCSLMFLVLFLESTYFPTIITPSTCSLGRHYKRGSKWIIGGVLAGAAVPPLLADLHNNTGSAMVVPLAVR
jgi:FHS family L-fucose permease-like MFS transporter